MPAKKDPEGLSSSGRGGAGRDSYATPDHLGEYILIDHVRNKRKSLRG